MREVVVGVEVGQKSTPLNNVTSFFGISAVFMDTIPYYH